MGNRHFAGAVRMFEVSVITLGRHMFPSSPFKYLNIFFVLD